MSIKIRKAEIKDFDFVYDFICNLEETQFDKNSFRSIYRKNLSDKNIFYFVAETKSSVIGFISIYIQPQLHHSANVAEIMELFVDENFRNKKTGAVLLKKAIAVARKNNCVLIELATNKRRKNAHRFYERENFSKTHFKFTRKIN